MARVAIVFEDVADGARKGVSIKMTVIEGDLTKPTEALFKAATTMQAIMAATKSTGREDAIEKDGVSEKLAAITGFPTESVAERPSPRTPAAPLRRAPRGHRP